MASSSAFVAYVLKKNAFRIISPLVQKCFRTPVTVTVTVTDEDHWDEEIKQHNNDNTQQNNDEEEKNTLLLSKIPKSENKKNEICCLP